jgi:hypothetical protein
MDTPAMTEQSKLSHHRFPQSVLSMLDHRTTAPALLPVVTPVHAHRGRVAGSHPSSARTATTVHACGQAAAPCFGMGAAQPWARRGRPVPLSCPR